MPARCCLVGFSSLGFDMRASLLLLALLAGCNPPSPTSAPAPAPALTEKPADGPPWSEGTANQKLKGLTDEEVKALCGAPESVGPPPDGSAERMWGYPAKKFITPAEGSKRTENRGMFVYFVRGQVVKVLPNNG
jgi:hypothetical protein